METQLENVLIDAWILSPKIHYVAARRHNVRILWREVLRLVDLDDVTLGELAREPERQSDFGAGSDVSFG